MIDAQHPNIAFIMTDVEARTLNVCSEYAAIRWLSSVPQLNIIGNIVPFIVRQSGDPTQTTNTWLTLARTIANEWEHYAGFVVFHEQNDIEYAACALAFLLHEQGKPIIFTGAYSKKDEGRSSLDRYDTMGTHANIMNACQLATLDLAETAILFGNTLTRATQSVRKHDPSPAIFKNNVREEPALGKIDFTINLAEHRKRRTLNRSAPKPTDTLDSRIVSFDLHPGMAPTAMTQIVPDNTRAVIVRTSSTQPLPEHQRTVLETIRDNGQAVIIVRTATPCDDAPFISGRTMTFPALLTKCMWALPQSKTPEGLSELLVNEIAGEFATPSPTRI